MEPLIIHNDVQVLEQRSWSYGSFSSIGYDNNDIIFHLCSDIDNDLKYVLEEILSLEPNILLTTRIKIYEHKVQKEETIFGQKKSKICDSYYSTVMVDYYSDDARLEHYNKIHRERFSLRDKKIIGNNLETNNSYIYNMTTGSWIESLKIYCSKKVWNKVIAKYKLNT